jgi:hypothetical protein
MKPTDPQIRDHIEKATAEFRERRTKPPLDASPLAVPRGWDEKSTRDAVGEIQKRMNR